MTVILYITKTIYIYNPDIHVFQVTCIKSFFSTILLLLWFNVQIKEIMYTSVDKSRDALIALIFKAVQSAASVLISYNAMKYFAISTTNVVTSLTPLVGVILAWLILGESINRWIVISVIIVLSSVLMIILGAEGEEEETLKANALALFLLCL